MPHFPGRQAVMKMPPLIFPFKSFSSVFPPRRDSRQTEN